MIFSTTSIAKVGSGTVGSNLADAPAIEDKDLIRGSLGRSPDHADAVAMAFAPGSPESWVSVGAMQVSL